MSGLDIEVPILLGFNLIKTDNFSAYTAIGINLSFGGYEETLSGSREGAYDALKESLPNGDFDVVTNEYSAFQIGLQWLGGIKYKMMDNVSIFTEVKWLDAAGIIDREGTATKGNPDGTKDENDAADAKAATKSALGGSLNGGIATSDQVSLINNTDKGGDVGVLGITPKNNVISALNRSYVRWVIGATYTLDL